MLDAAVVDREKVDATVDSALPTVDAVLAPLQLFERPLALLRITNSQISLFHIRLRGDGTEAMGFLLRRLFDLEALIEPLADGSFALLFVRYNEDQATMTARVLRTIREAMGVPAFEGRGRVDITAVHRHSGFIGESEDLFAELAVKVANGSDIVAP